MKVIAGVDIGNSTTEVCLARLHDDKRLEFLGSALTVTTGMKGTVDNVKGVVTALKEALEKAGLDLTDLDMIRLNEAAPVIGDTAMETITETIITESTMIGHDPSTPGGMGLGIGEVIPIKELAHCNKKGSYVVLVDSSWNFEHAAVEINKAFSENLLITGVIVQKDEGVLISNRLVKRLPVVDEVKYIDRVPLHCQAAVEVADTGQSIQVLSNPYGIASIFHLDAAQTRRIAPIAKSLVGNRSAVVIRTPEGEVKERILPAGTVHIRGEEEIVSVAVDAGAEVIMQAVEGFQTIQDIQGEKDTNVGNMLKQVKESMAELTGESADSIRIRDMLAVDTEIPIRVQGGLAGEKCMEKAVGIAAMVQTDKLPMQKVAERLQKETGVYVKIAGIEAVMASLGAMTTPGVTLPLAVLDLGGGSTDAAILEKNGIVRTVHLAGAGELVTMLINLELGLEERFMAEQIKRFPLAKVESLYQIRLENGSIQFFDSPLERRLFARVVVLTDKGMLPIEKELTLEKIAAVRKEAKKKVFLQNILRALKITAPEGELRRIPNVVLVGGSALDFEIPQLALEELLKYKVVAGRANIRKVEGPRNAVATGLVLSSLSE